MPKKRTRLSKKLEKRSRQNLILTIIGIVAISFLFIRYGIPLLGNVSYFIGQLTSVSKDESVVEKDNIYVSTPRLDSLPRVVGEAEILITGSSNPNTLVELYLNGFVEDEVVVDESGEFEFTITLTNGENIIKARASLGEAESDFTKPLTVMYRDTKPELTIDTPSDGQDLKGENPISVTGATEKDISVTVNGFRAIIGPGNTYSYQLLLKEGGNEIKVVAKDSVGNTKELVINVNYSP